MLVVIVFALFSTLSVNGSDNNLRGTDALDINRAYSLPNEIDREELLVHGDEDPLIQDGSENNILRVDTSERNKVYPLSNEIDQADSLVHSDEDRVIQNRELVKKCGGKKCKCNGRKKATCININQKSEKCKCRPKKSQPKKPKECPKDYDLVCFPGISCQCRSKE